MMSSAAVALSVIALACGSSAASPGSPTTTPSQVEVTLDQEFALAPGKSARLASLDLTIRFDEVRNESRCPRNVTCVWAGNAEVVLTLQRGKAAPREVTLNTTLEPKSVTDGNETLTLTGLTPVPDTQHPVQPGDYRATLRVAPKPH